MIGWTYHAALPGLVDPGIEGGVDGELPLQPPMRVGLLAAGLSGRRGHQGVPGPQRRGRGRVLRGSV